ncbi:hypothetical protein JTB14_015527 [Gonioctena quinquepunctata]|nr:hypothetical protein JTB14_015527 [Gonioctena quinquepunctata]
MDMNQAPYRESNFTRTKKTRAQFQDICRNTMEAPSSITKDDLKLRTQQNKASTSQHPDNDSNIEQIDPDTFRENEPICTRNENQCLAIVITEKPINKFIMVIKVDQNPRMEIKKIIGNPVC